MAARLDEILSKGRRPIWDWGDPGEWRSREWNRQADFLVNRAMDEKASQHWTDATLFSLARTAHVLVFCDGGLRRSTQDSAAGWAAYVQIGGNFKLFAYEAEALTNVQSAFSAEVIALDMALKFLKDLF